jgi:hypothetical protein
MAPGSGFPIAGKVRNVLAASDHFIMGPDGKIRTLAVFLRPFIYGRANKSAAFTL